MNNNAKTVILSVLLLLLLCVAIPASAGAEDVGNETDVGTSLQQSVPVEGEFSIRADACNISDSCGVCGCDADAGSPATHPPLGYIPPPNQIADRTPLDTSLPVMVNRVGVMADEPLPVAYDLRDCDRMTSVKNQGDCGSCWTFATLGSLESYLRGEEELAYNFSENNMKNKNGFDWGPCGGGNYEMATAYLTRWDVPDGVSWYSGPVSEADDPYHDDSLSTSPDEPPIQKHVQNVLFLPIQSPGDNMLVKNVLQEYGAVGAYITYNETKALNMSGSAPSYYYSASEGMANEGGHAIVLAGWDDTYPKERFTVTPPGDGAYLAKNSWGSTWGSDGGYFYISYYDEQVNDGITLFTAEETNNYDFVYYHDALGATRFGGLGTTTATFANVFTASGNETIDACGVYTYEADAEVDVAIHLNPVSGPTNPAAGAVSTTSETPTLPGYHTITLSTPVNVCAGETFSVVVTVTNPTLGFTVPLERARDDYSSAAVSAIGESYYQTDAGNWVDTYEVNEWGGANVCIKAYTTDWHAAVAPVANFTAAPVSGTAPLTVVFNDTSTGTPTGWNWTFGDSATATNQHPTHTYTAAGTYNVSFTVTNAVGTDTRTETGFISVTPPAPTARFDFNRNAVALTENNTFTPGTYVTNYTYRLHAVNTDAAAVLGNLSYVAAAENITWVDNERYAAWNASYSEWTFPPATVMGPGNGIDVRAGTATSTATDYTHTLNRVCNVTIFRANGVQHTNVTVTFDDLDFESVFVGFAAAKDTNVTTTIIPGSVTTNASIVGSLPLGGDYHLKLDTGALVVGDEYYFAFDTLVSLNGSAVIYKPLVYVWEGMSHTSAELGETYTAAVPAAMLPADGTAFSVATNTSCTWSVVRQNNLLSVIEGDLTLVVTAVPVANFTATPVNGTAPLTVVFTDTSTGGPAIWNWSFGDGATATDQHPTHTYTAVGTYNVSLTVTNAVGTDTHTETGFISVTPPAPTARFDFNRNAVALTENNTFTPGTYVTNYTYRLHAVNTDAAAVLGNLSYVAAAENITWVDNDRYAAWNASYSEWTFPPATVMGLGNGIDVRAGTATSTATDYTHTLNRVCNVTIFRANGVQHTNVTVTFDDLDFESVCVGFAAAKDANVTTTIIPGSVTTNASIVGSLPLGGDYHLKLDTGALVVGDEYYFAFDTLVSLNGSAVIYKPLVYVWEGMSHTSAELGETYTAAVPAAMLPADGTAFSVATNTSCTWSVVRQNNLLSVIEGDLTLVATAVPVANFTAAPVNGTAPLTVVFTDTSTGGPAIWNWSFGDGAFSKAQNPTHTYTESGLWNASLTITNYGGSDTFGPVLINVTQSSWVRGDFNENSYVDIGDVAWVAYMAVGRVASDIRADFNHDNVVDNADAAMIAWYYVGKIHQL